MRGRLGWMNPATAPARRATSIDLAWAAGIFEGEGYCRQRTSAHGGTEEVQIRQKDPWLLHKLREFAGGYVVPKQFPVSLGFEWKVTGARARGFLMSIYGLLSPRRQKQVRTAMRLEGESEETK